jgi:antitoxin component YwqK of YwqJK toxin-antitoxin module
MFCLNTISPWRASCAAVLTLCTFAPTFAAAVADDSQGGETIDRYTGPPIFLDEPESPPPAKLVEKRVDKDTYPDGKTLRYERQIGRFSDDHYEADGFYREYYPNGQKFVEGQYKDGHQEGTWTYYHDNGKVQRTVTYSNGQPDGSWDVYNAEGAVVAKRGYKNGKRDGTWVVYDESGKQPLREEVYTDGKANGVWKVWFPSGQQKNEISVKDGVRDGPYAEWDEKGNKRLDLNFADGKFDGTATLLGVDGQKVVQHYDHGKLLKDAKE